MLGEIRATSTDRETPLADLRVHSAPVGPLRPHICSAPRISTASRGSNAREYQKNSPSTSQSSVACACGPVGASSKDPKVILPCHCVPPKPCERENKMCPSTSSREKGTTDRAVRRPTFLGAARHRPEVRRDGRKWHRKKDTTAPALAAASAPRAPPRAASTPLPKKTSFHTSSTPVSCRIGIWEGTRERWNGWRSDTT